MLIHLDLSRYSLWALVTGKQFDPGQARETGVDLVPNHFTSVTGVKAWSLAIFFVFPEVCILSDLVNIADPDQVLRHAASGKTIMFRDVSFLFN